MQLEFFPSRTTSFYMARMFAIRILAVMALLVLVLQTLDLLGESGKILTYEGNGQAELLTYVSLRVPQLIAQFLPFSVLLATIVTLATLNQNSEIVSMKAAGLSAHQILAPLLLTSLIVAALAFVFNDRVVSRATATLSLWEAAEFGPIPEDLNTRRNVYVRADTDVIRAASVSGMGKDTVLSDVNVYVRDISGGLREILSSEIATYSGTHWTLYEPFVFDLVSGNKRRVADRIVGEGVTPDQFTLSDINANGLSFGELGSVIDELKAAGRRTNDLETVYWHKISSPLSSVLMPLLGAIAAFGLARSGRLFFRAVCAMALGFAYFVADNFALSMGSLDAYPPLLAAWAPFMLFLLVGETVLVRTEE